MQFCTVTDPSQKPARARLLLIGFLSRDTHDSVEANSVNKKNNEMLSSLKTVRCRSQELFITPLPRVVFS